MEPERDVVRERGFGDAGGGDVHGGVQRAGGVRCAGGAVGDDRGGRQQVGVGDVFGGVELDADDRVRVERRVEREDGRVFRRDDERGRRGVERARAEGESDDQQPEQHRVRDAGRDGGLSGDARAFGDDHADRRGGARGREQQSGRAEAGGAVQHGRRDVVVHQCDVGGGQLFGERDADEVVQHRGVGRDEAAVLRRRDGGHEQDDSGVAPGRVAGDEGGGGAADGVDPGDADAVFGAVAGGGDEPQQRDGGEAAGGDVHGGFQREERLHRAAGPQRVGDGEQDEQHHGRLHGAAGGADGGIDAGRGGRALQDTV